MRARKLRPCGLSRGGRSCRLLNGRRSVRRFRTRSRFAGRPTEKPDRGPLRFRGYGADPYPFTRDRLRKPKNDVAFFFFFVSTILRERKKIRPQGLTSAQKSGNIGIKVSLSIPQYIVTEAQLLYLNRVDCPVPTPEIARNAPKLSQLGGRTANRTALRRNCQKHGKQRRSAQKGRNCQL